MRIFFSSFLILWTLNQVVAQNATKAHKDSLNTIIQKYYDLNLKVFQANSKIEDIDKVFELFSYDFTYIHPKYGGTYTRKDLYNGYIKNQKNGGYNGEETAVKIINRITGLNAVVVHRSYVISKNGELKDENPKMTLFEFKKGKIFRIFEYW
ncbi:nuclear transport factor 2 family protein [uncultured Tenacibaculum sp.]|uniref:nuclear transport factor 2 family protein n=1 Tax=uncultured Tenacibaculum sp. TaxID=174713 RepID=UPI0026267687|nr:nuclear transport factor 2 family protein [uncultured Tenacibaculum sp.]